MTTQEELDERYGRGPRPARRRAFWIIVALVAAASVGALAWSTIAGSVQQVGYDGTGHEIVDDRTVTVSFQVTPPAGAAFACALEALDEDFGVVGWRVVEFPASDANARAFVETIPTLARATTGLVHSCWVT
ncbi:MAG TPA: DUF4307 domain-containing protein [Microbacterium sp.]|uniref:DUF4307 domain-containing protein n=1 Tax=Microbacterium sp. TaxID=51671 RepID=UPI002C0B701B|nr:DUF4307 domain-containing protein [Microbacterium sp.]HWI32543.1 DUF4307 domain-containing protein [Microbacterium sp.]